MRLPIHYKITFVFVILATIIFSGIYFYLETNLTRHALNRIRADFFIRTDLAVFILNTPGFIWKQSPDKTADTIGLQVKARLTIIREDGTVVGDSEVPGKELAGLENHRNRPEIEAALQTGQGESIRFSTTVGENMLYIARSFRAGPELFVIRLALPLAEVKAVSGRLRQMLIAALALAFVIALGLSSAAAFFISRPLSEAVWAARSVARGDFSQKRLLNSNDELGDLSRAINHMSSQIKLTLEEVQTNKSRLEAVLLSMIEGVMVVDRQGTIILMNHTLQNLLGLEDDPLGKRPLEVIRNIEIQEIAENASRLTHQIERHQIAVHIPEERIFQVHVTPLIRSGIAEGAVLVFHDITELRRLERIRQDFVANVSHELRTPVASIKGYAETLLEGALQDKKNAGDFVKIIYDDADRLAKLINDLLDLSRIESGAVTVNLKSCALPPLIEKVIAGMQAQARAREISLKTDMPDDIAQVNADQSQIVEVLVNLIDNAIKYTDPGGSVMVSVHDNDRMVQIDVADTGIGIPETDLSRIFERFYRVDKGRSRSLGGTGLGLSIVKHIVQAHKGEVSLRSVLGKGSVFSFTLPKAA